MRSGRLVLQENKQEARQIWKMFKKDPLSPASAYWRNFGMPGIGLFLEGYVVSHVPHPNCQWLVVLPHHGLISDIGQATPWSVDSLDARESTAVDLL